MQEPALLHHYLTLAQPYLQQYGYGAVFAAVLVEGFGVPAPGQSLIIAGALLASQGQLDLPTLILTAWSAAVVGDNIGFAIGHFGGRRLVLHHGRHIGVHEDHLHRVEHFFARFGGMVVVAARFFEVLRQLNGVVAGLAGMSWWRFLIYNATGAALWVAVWGLGVYHLGSHMAQTLTVLKTLEPYVAGTGILALLATLVYVVQRRNR